MLISIIVATYNSAKTLTRCLDSIVTQLGNDCELLVIDGGSKDGTLEIINKYRDKIAYTISEHDYGVYDAWNKAIVKTRGKWLTFIGSDDEMISDTIEKYKEFFKENGEDYDLISGKLHFLSKNGMLIRDAGEPYSWTKLVNRKLNLAHPGMLHNRRCFEKYGLFDIQYKVCGDSDFLQRLGKDVKTGYIDEFLVNMTEGGLSDSFELLREGYLIRYRNHSIGRTKLLLTYGRSYLSYALGRIKTNVLGLKRK